MSQNSPQSSIAARAECKSGANIIDKSSLHKGLDESPKKIVVKMSKEKVAKRRDQVDL